MKDEHYLKQPLPFAECRYSLNSGRHYKPHMHKTFSIGAIDNGEVIYQIENEKISLTPGAIALMNPETLHFCNPADSCTRSYYVLYLDVKWCLKLQQSLWKITTFNPAKNVNLKDDIIFKRFIQTMNLLMNVGDQLEKEQTLASFMENIFLKVCHPASKNIESEYRLDHIKESLGNNLDEDISLNQLAEKLDANPFTLLRQFKSEVGITPHAYRLNCRIEHAKQLLQKGLDLSSVALECGFFDQSHFHRNFKAITTVTPKEYQVNFIQ